TGGKTFNTSGLPYRTSGVQQLVQNMPLATGESHVGDRLVTGKVSDANGDYLPGVSILLKGTQKGTISGVDGRFSLEVPEEDAVLIFSFVGYLNEEVEIGSRITFDV